MLSYLVRRILLIIPTLIGATAVIFMLMALSPISIVDVLLPPGGNLQPGQRAARETYLQERYGLGDPAVVQYLRWLNNISPVGFRTWKGDDPQVVEAKKKQAELRAEKERELAAAGVSANAVQRELRKVVVRPRPGDIRLDRPAIKAPDLGSSFVQSRPVWPIIATALPTTLLLEAVSLPFAIAIAVVSGIWSAKHRGKAQDVVTGSVLLALYSIPVMWVGVMMVGYLANVHYVKMFPAEGLHDMRAGMMSFFPTFRGGFRRGYLLDSVWHLALPVLCISYGMFAFYSKLTRTALLETLSADFVRTCRAKGLPERITLYRHAFRNSLLPIITTVAMSVPSLILGTVVIETIFGLNGMGRLVVDSLKGNDRELFLSASVIWLVLQLGAYLLADVLYAVADPRVSYDDR
jgi:ABC-type dipeptide/oligopeptide/nickel transport system permease component